MGWFDDRIDVHFKMYCHNCGWYFYPYCEKWTLGKSTEQVFEALSGRKCEKCGKSTWGHNL